MTEINAKRISLFMGHYGSGKTNIAINYAHRIRQSGKEVAIADLDIVNPYFRMKDSQEEMLKEGIDVIALPFANSSVDLPALPSAAYSLVQNTARYAVLDIGGDDRGALALGRFTPYIREENNFDVFFVANFYRPLTTTAADAMEVMREIEAASGLPFTGIINNSNLGAETTAGTVLGTLERCAELSKLSGLPVVFTSVHESLEEELTGQIPRLFSLRLQHRIFDL